MLCPWHMSLKHILKKVWHNSKISIISYLSRKNNFKGTVSVISKDPTCKDINSRFTTVPLKP